MNPKYPIYIPSKGRWESRMTSKALEAMGVPYKIVVEPQEYDKYAAVIDPAKILVLPWSKPESSTELVPTRNWIWEHSTAAGAKRHWQLDDNIKMFWRFNGNRRYPAWNGSIFRAAEEFADRHTNVAQAGFHYFMFAPSRNRLPPYMLNSRVYSCTMNLNSVSNADTGPYRYRGVYNDDTDISLRILKERKKRFNPNTQEWEDDPKEGKWCTVLFIAFLAQKMPTMKVKGGNTPIYQGKGKEGGRYKMAKSLQEQHPDLVRIVEKWGRWQHFVDYSKFNNTNRLELIPGIEIAEGTDEFGMVFRWAK